jgi:UDP-N-acetylmuramoylalanine--D-glutamate ligase
MISDYQGQRVTVMGLGRFGGGVGVTRFLSDHGGDVLVTDTLPPEELKASIDAIAGLPGVSLRLGEHNISDFTTPDLVVVNPAVKPGNRFVRAAEAAGVPITSEIRLLVKHLPDRRKTIGITGTAGKSTVTAMLGHVLKKVLGGQGTQGSSGEADSGGRVHVGGNLGGSLLPRVESIQPEDWVVLELSSFMLEGLREDRWSPHIAVITNISPNHLDWHGSMEDYIAAKQVILDFQKDIDGDFAIGGGGTHTIFEEKIDIARADLASSDDELRVSPPLDLLLPGHHNQVNARLAFKAVDAALGMTPGHNFGLLNDFPGLPHRLQHVGTINGVTCINDSKSTTPDATRLALESFPDRPARLMCGGYDKGSDLTPLIEAASEKAAAVYTIGATGPAITDAGNKRGQTPFFNCEQLQSAVQRAIHDARPGDVLLLSPGCASWDQFENYEQRGERLIELLETYRAK